MNGKKIACVLLMMIVAGIAYGAQIMQQRAKAMQEESDAAETDDAHRLAPQRMSQRILALKPVTRFDELVGADELATGHQRQRHHKGCMRERHAT